ncbi:MAG: [protein-PII] uridylyltransferase [Desulfobacterales bacterium]|nr:[protein-PII] uridylyltransferase [Desulfobacterales bacterium]
MQSETPYKQAGDLRDFSGMVQTAIEPQDFTGLRARRQALDAYWKQSISGYALVRKHSDFIDHHLADSFEKSAPPGEGFALVALGGYGRQELYPFSDIDLMLFYDPAQKDELSPLVDAILYPLWDAGLEVGHGVRTLEECMVDASEDFFFRVAMLDARLIAGSSALFSRLTEMYKTAYIEGKRQEFLDDMLEQRAKRETQYSRHTYLLEPHIKESCGGFRDIQSMVWTAQVVFGLKDLNSLQEAGLLSPEELKKFEEAQDFLVRIRNRLHYLSGRKNDQLFFEHQEEMAGAFGFKNEKDILAVECFMRQVYGHMQIVSVTTGLFFEHVVEVLGSEKSPKAGKMLEPGIEIRHGRIHLSSSEFIRSMPKLFIRLFYQAAKTGKPLHFRTRKAIAANLHMVDDKLRNSRRTAKLFLAILTAPEPFMVLEEMLDTGFLTAYIPEFAKVASLAQHDVYHVFTVDRHLARTIHELEKLKGEVPGIFAAVGSQHILFLAGLLHDIGKGFGQGHADRGADMARQIGERLRLEPEKLDALEFLVRNHLFLSNTALRRDLEDEEFLRRCAAKIHSPEKLVMLYLLTIADARATGPTVWNEWKGALLLELYHKLALLIDSNDLSGHEQVRGAELGAQWIREKVFELLPDANEKDFDLFSDDYLLSFPPEVIVQHIVQAKKLGKQDVLFSHEQSQDSWSILVMTKDRPGLLAGIFGILALHNLKVLAAKIFTWVDGTAVDTIEVSSAISETYDGQDWETMENELHLVIKQRFGIEHRLSQKLAPLKTKPQGVQQRLAANVTIDNQASELYSVIEVFSKDRIGILYDITKTLSDFGISVYRARIGSKADQVVDVFYVLDYDGKKIESPAFKNELQQGLLYAVTNE